MLIKLIRKLIKKYIQCATRPIFMQNEFGRWLQFFISLGIAKRAVPLFFLFSAFLQAKRNGNSEYISFCKYRNGTRIIV